MRSWLHVAVALLAGLVAGCHEPMDSAGTDVDVDTAAFEEQQRAGAAENLDDVSFTARLLSPTNVFRQGERIPVELSFSSRVPGRYMLNGALYDRSGRLATERYHVAPAGGTSDPLADYFDDGIFFGGGLRSDPMLGDEPQTLVFDLNEWLRFDAPGPYRLFVESSRVFRAPGANGEAGAFEGGEMTSGLLAFDVVPADAAWEAGVLADAGRALDAAPDGAYDDAAREAARSLRFLDTIDAAREMSARWEETGGVADGELMFGLVGSRHRAEVVSFLEERLDAPGAPVGTPLLDVLAWLRIWLDREARPPPDETATGYEARFLARRTVSDGYAARLAEHVECKTSAARAESVAALMEVAWGAQGRREAFTPPWYARVAQRMPEVFADLRPEKQRQLLDHRWRRLAGPAMLPVVRRLAAAPDADPELRATALRRLVELAPEEARLRILDAIRAPGPPLGYGAYRILASLPDATLPELDDALVDRFEGSLREGSSDDPALAAALLARYATAGVSERAWAAWTSARRDMGDGVAGAVLAFFARVDPAHADDLAQADLARARTTGKLDTLTRAADLGMGPPIERALLDALDEGDAALAAPAAHALGEHGSPAAAPHLWRRLERWHAAWRGRSNELRPMSTWPDPGYAERTLEGELRGAITDGAAWLTDGAALARLGALLVTEDEKTRLGYARQDWATGRVAVGIVRSDDGTTHATVAHYQLDAIDRLEAKLAQFPRGARFVWQPPPELPADAAEIEAFVTARGMSIDR
jgi:hypothetical protein